MSDKNKKEKPSWVKEIFSPEYIKRDFALMWRERKTAPFVVWGLFGLAAANFLAGMALFAVYIIKAIYLLTKT